MQSCRVPIKFSNLKVIINTLISNRHQIASEDFFDVLKDIVQLKLSFIMKAALPLPIKNVKLTFL